MPRMKLRRRRPVPREWRDQHHRLGYGHTRIAGGGWGGHARSYRYGATCACGERFGEDAGNHTMQRPDVIEAWKDHVEEEYYKEQEGGGVDVVV